MSSSGSSTSRTGILIVALATAIVVGVVSSLPSCDGPPDKTCFADRVNAFAEVDSGLGADCTTCLQTKGAPHACCDAVGACDEDPDKQCVPSFQATHQCVVEGGPSAEPRCKGLLTNDKSRALYACMRANCGHECGVPSCDVDPAVVLFENPTCDGCIGGACCEKINACYKERTCKLVVECIAEHCPRTLGPAMTALGLVSADARLAAEDEVCAGRPLPASDDLPEHACLEKCLDDFAPGGDAGTADDQTARCLAFGVFACGAEAKCGPSCTDAGSYGRDEPWSEDSPADASVADAKGP